MENSKQKPISQTTPVTVGLLILLLGLAFWLGVQHAQLRNLGERMNDLSCQVKTVIQDHEKRLRALEQKP